MGIAAAGAVVIEVIGGVNGLYKALGKVVERASPVTQYHAFASMRINDLFELPCHIIQGLLPSGSPPLTAAAGTRPDQRELGAFVIIIFQREAGSPLGTKARAHGLIIGIALNPDRPLVFDLHKDGAARGAHPAHAEDPASTRDINTRYVGWFVQIHNHDPP